MNINRQNKGITLVALVITIIVLLILAGVTIATLVGDNGILNKATKAKASTEVAGEKEEVELAYMEGTMEGTDTQTVLNKTKEILEKTERYNTTILGSMMTVISKSTGNVYEINGSKIEYKGVSGIYSDKEPIMMSINSNYAFWQGEYPTKISKIEIKNYIVKPENIVEEWDVSASKNKSVLAWVVDDNNDGYELTIAANGIIKMSKSASQLFRMFTQVKEIDLLALDTSNVTDMGYMFSGCKSLEKIDVSKLETSNVTSMMRMFYGCSSLKSLDVSNFHSERVTNMFQMFYGCSSLTEINLINFSTRSATNIDSMFSGCSSIENIDVSSFDTRNVTDMAGMFQNCYKLTSIDVSNFDTSKATSLYLMFSGCSSLTSLNLSTFNTENVTNMCRVFINCSNLETLDISSFNTEKVTNVETLFYNCSKLREIDMSNFNMKNFSSAPYLMFGYVPTTVSIKTNATMKEWLNINFPELTNVTIK